jgi:hypothetical protein
MKAGLVPLVCLLVLVPICAFVGWRFGYWYLQRKILQVEEGRMIAQLGGATGQPTRNMSSGDQEDGLGTQTKT